MHGIFYVCLLKPAVLPRLLSIHTSHFLVLILNIRVLILKICKVQIFSGLTCEKLICVTLGVFESMSYFLAHPFLA
jgi:hypothetical protein